MLWLSQYYYMISLSAFGNIIVVSKKKKKRKKKSVKFIFNCICFFLLVWNVNNSGNKSGERNVNAIQNAILLPVL